MQFKNNIRQLRNFGYLIGLGFPITFGFLLPIVSGHDLRIWAFLIGMPFLILGLVKPRLLDYPYRYWMRLGLALGWINSKLILGLIFILVLFPLALIMRIIGYDPLKIKINKNDSFRKEIKKREIDLTKIF